MSSFGTTTSGMGFWSMPRQTPITPSPWELYKAAWLALNPEALFIADEGVTEISGRTSLWQDLTGHGHDIIQPTAGNKPLFVTSGIAPLVKFDRTRPDFLYNASAIALGTNPYTFVLVRKYNNLATIGTFASPVHNGSVFIDGQAIIEENGAGTPLDKQYHWGPPATAIIDSAPDLAIRSAIVRWDGASVLSRISGVDQVPVIQVACATPTGPFVVGSWNATGTSPADMDLYMLAVFKRSLSPAELTICSNLFNQHYSFPAWSPIDLPNILTYLRSDYNVSLPSGAVSNWTDVGPVGRVFTQATPANQPLGVLNAYGSIPAVRGNADGARSVAAGAYSFTAGKGTVAMVFSSSTLASTYLWDNGTGSCGFIQNFSGTKLEWINGADRYTFSLNPGPGLHVAYVTQVNGGALVGYFDGAPVFSQIATVNLQTPRRILGYVGLTNGSNGDALEVLAVDRILTATERSNYFAYTLARYGK